MMSAFNLLRKFARWCLRERERIEGVDKGHEDTCAGHLATGFRTIKVPHL